MVRNSVSIFPLLLLLVYRKITHLLNIYILWGGGGGGGGGVGRRA